MKAAAARPLYRGVEGEERFRILLLALARGDLPEAKHLLASTPRTRVAARDPSMLAAHRRFEALRANFAAAAGPPLGMLAALEAIEPLLTRKATGAFGEATVAFGVEIGYAMQRMLGPPATRVRALLVALEEQAREQLGLPAEPILALLPVPIANGLVRHGWVIEAVEPDEDDLVAAREALDPEGGR